MGKINELKPNVFNMIAAGEVVERPSSVVKELIENSLDAGATIINVDIEDGGLKLIKVSDNGVGMDKSDLVMSLKPHATSKLTVAEDLSVISTFGFRGEALASINSVSKIKITSKVDGQNAYTYSPEISNSPIDSSRNVGTTVEICDLFYNVPARLKFLKSVKTEEKYIYEKVADLILANPDVSITLDANGKTLIQSNGGGAKEALYSVYGSLADKFFEMDYQKSNFFLRGFISDSEHTKSTRSGQAIIVNGRVVQDRNISLAVEKAYGSLIMKHTYPMYVISLILPFDFVDVNVHPQKAEVRFQSPNAVFGFVYKSVAETLALNETSFSLQTEIDRKLKENAAIESHQLDFSDLNASESRLKEGGTLYSVAMENCARSIENNGKSENLEYKLRDFNSDKLYCKNGVADENADEKFLKSKTALFGGGEADRADKISDFNDETTKSDLRSVLFDCKKSSDGVEKAVSSDLYESYTYEKINDYSGNFDFETESIKVLCSLFDTYLLVKNKSKIYLIDQHAAHERIIFDRLMNSVAKEEVISQPMLFSFSEEVDELSFARVKNILPSLQKIGFEISTDDSNNRIEILALPAILMNVKIKEFLHNLLHSFDDDIKIEKLLYERICQTACKSAIKGGDSLTDEQLDYLIQTFNENLPKQCPHGRPAIIEIEKTALEKLFKRIV